MTVRSFIDGLTSQERSEALRLLVTEKCEACGGHGFNSVFAPGSPLPYKRLCFAGCTDGWKLDESLVERIGRPDLGALCLFPDEVRELLWWIVEECANDCT